MLGPLLADASESCNQHNKRMCHRDVQTANWRQVPTGDRAPTGRFGHTAVVHGHMMIIFGGRTSAFYNDVWAFDFSAKKWRELDCEGHGPLPTPRAGHTAVCMNDRAAMVVFAGGVDPLRSCNDVWILDMDLWKWSPCVLSNDALMPTNRKGHTAVWDAKRHRMIVFGGCGSSPALADNQIWSLDLRERKWYLLSTNQDSRPSPRMYHVAELTEKGTMLIFGGKTVSRGTIFLDDLYELNLELGSWTRIRTVGAPSGRMCAASLYRDGIFCVLMGGSTSYLNDCHELDTVTGEWRAITSDGTTPCTRPTAVLHDNQVTIFGGCDGESTYLNSTLELLLEPPSLKELCRQWLRRVSTTAHFDPSISSSLNKYLNMSH